MKIALAQFNPVVGYITENARRIVETANRAADRGADLVVFPELSLIGYSAHDLLDNRHFIDGVEAGIDWIHLRVPQNTALLFGAPLRNREPAGKRLFNAAIFLERGRAPQHVLKMLLPTYDIYDEYRYFEPSSGQQPIDFCGLRLGIHICEDMWNLTEYSTYHSYERDPVAELIDQGAQILINLSASPFSHGRHDVRTRLISDICLKHRVPFVLVNQVGANTELIFDGDSRVHNAKGDLVRCAASFEESLLIWDTSDIMPREPEPRSRTEEMHKALVFGIREYASKTGVFDKALVGLSGGIDSAVTAALAVEALGQERVMGITMPSEYSSAGSVDDSMSLAENLSIPCHTLSIRAALDSIGDVLYPLFDGTRTGVAEENIQARTRGLILMAVSNKFNHLLLATGNKSEMAMGYATLYGDMSGGLAVLADVFKIDVYALAEHINTRAGREIIPGNTIEKPPSAELRPDQKDEDSLPPYPVLDEILRLYIECRLDSQAISEETGNDLAFVSDILAAVDRSEYKRKQAAPSLRVSDKAFGTGRRMPIVMQYDRESMIEMMKEMRQHTAL